MSASDAKKNQDLDLWKLQSLPIQSWNLSRLQETMGRFVEKEKGQFKILVVGDVGLDRYTLGSVERISPEAPVPIVRVEQEWTKLGLAANVSDNIRALGGESFLVGSVGCDRIGSDLRKSLVAAGISDRHLVEDSERRTILKERIVSEQQQLLRVDYESSQEVSESVQSALMAHVERLIGDSDFVIIEDYAKGLLTSNVLFGVIQSCKRAKKWVAVDPNSGTPAESYRGATIMTPNQKEAEWLSGVSIRDSKSLVQAGTEILKKCECEYVIMTRGKDGIAIFEKEKTEAFLIPTLGREVFDVSGAGDTVVAMIAMALAAKATIHEAAILGNIAAGIEVGKKGTATVSVEEVQFALESFVSTQKASEHSNRTQNPALKI